MRKNTDFTGQLYAIFGSGNASMVTAAILIKSGARVLIWDDNEKRQATIQQAGFDVLHPNSWPWHELNAVVIAKPDTTTLTLSDPIFQLAQKHKVALISDVEILVNILDGFPAKLKPKIIAVTGSNGKSMMVDLLAHMLQEAGKRVAIGNQTSHPALQVFAKELPDFIILEMTARKLAFTKTLAADASIILCIRDSDRRFFKTRERCLRSYLRVFRNQKNNEAMIIGADDLAGQKICTALTAGTSAQDGVSENIIPVSGEAALGQGIFSLQGHAFDARDGKTALLGELTMAPIAQGKHGNLIISACYAAGLHFGLNETQIAKSVQSWAGLDGRMHRAGIDNNIQYIDDSMAKDPAASAAALGSAKTIFWIVGGAVSYRDYSAIEPYAENIQKAFYFGTAGKKAHDLTNFGYDRAIVPALDEAILQAISEAQHFAHQNPEQSVTVLFSPAMPSPKQAAFAKLYSSILSAREERGVA
ncbi:MAG: Mur ligase family protein [bacterium]